MKKKLLLLGLTCSAVFLFWRFEHKERVVYVEPGFLGKIFADPQNDFYDIGKTCCKNGIKVKRVKSPKRVRNFEKIVVFEILLDKFDKYSHIDKEKKILFLWEPPSVLPHNYDKRYHEGFSKIYTWKDDLVDNRKYFKFYYPELRPMLQSLPFNEKKFCIMVARNKTSLHKDELYSKRLAVARFFEERAPEDFEIYGTGWEALKNTFKGRLPSKDSLKEYKFSICYENICNIQGYITEKIFDCFHAACVPVYWGAENVTDYIPKSCFIDRRDFKSDDELYLFLKNMREDEHEAYLTNIRQFLESDKAKLFSPENFRRIFMEAVK